MKKYLIGYDISNEKRLQKIHRKMIKFATPIQYSVFIFEGTEKELKVCLGKIMNIFNNKEDDLRIYLLPTKGKQWQLGKSLLPEGIVWTGFPMLI